MFISVPKDKSNFRINIDFIKFYQPNGQNQTAVYLHDEMTSHKVFDINVKDFDELITRAGVNIYDKSDLASKNQGTKRTVPSLHKS